MRIRILIGLLLIAAQLDAQSTGRRRALLIGINDYSASRIASRPMVSPAPERHDVRNLNGAVNDVVLLQQTLPRLYGFDPHDVIALTDQSATREAILRGISDVLLKPAAKGDVLLLYFAGHGSQVLNSLSDEPDKLDESIVPADSRLGVRDIRDKELRLLFNRILDRGARLTVILDNCYSGSGARGLLTGLRSRGLKPDRRDIADASHYGPRPENRGALVLSAAQDFDQAWETRDESGRFHGAFTWALLRALREAEPHEAARDTFLRAQARLRGETPYQEPVMAGNADARLNPLLGGRADRRAGDRDLVAVVKIRSDGTIVLRGGWANNLAVGTELRVGTQRVVVTAVNGMTESFARLKSNERVLPQIVHPGALLEVVGWSAPAGREMQVSISRTAMNVAALTKLAQTFAGAASHHNIRWISDPTIATPTYQLRYTASGWELVDASGNIERIGSDEQAVTAIAKLPKASSLFVQFPLLATAAIDVEADQPSNPDYVLVGRYVAGQIRYAWVRPSVNKSDRRKCGLPIRTDWATPDRLSDALFRLRRIHAWQLMESPQRARSPYSLALRRERDGTLVNDGVVSGGEKYSLLLRSRLPMPPRVAPRYIYVFAIDSWGNSTLLFPVGGSVENRFPLPGALPSEIPLGRNKVVVGAPYGIDTYFLLTADEPLPDPAILSWSGVRTRDPQTFSPYVTPASWSIERLICESVAPRR